MQTMDQEALTQSDLKHSISNGTYVSLRGKWVVSQGSGQPYELDVGEVETLGEGNTAVGHPVHHLRRRLTRVTRTTRSKRNQCPQTFFGPSLTFACAPLSTPL
jgi:aspartyl/asparaginyl-tRNA synthetase